MKQTVYGYVRVSTKEQNEARQMIAMRRQNIPESHIYVDKQSGKDFLRPRYQKLVGKMRREDTLYIQSIDRLGRSYEEIIEQWRMLTKEKGVDIVVIDMPLLDTRRDKNLLGSFLSDIVLQVLSFVAENERSNIHTRQAEGIQAARARGVRFGRPGRDLPDSFEPFFQAWRQGRITVREAAQGCGMAKSSFYDAALRREAMEAELADAFPGRE